MKLVNLLLRQLIAKSPNKEKDLTLKAVSPKVLHTKLRKGTVSFMFQKKDGTMRIAQGTLQLDKVPSHLQPRGLKEPTPLQINYFDTVKMQWRSMSSNTIIYM